MKFSLVSFPGSKSWFSSPWQKEKTSRSAACVISRLRPPQKDLCGVSPLPSFSPWPSPISLFFLPSFETALQIAHLAFSYLTVISKTLELPCFARYHPAPLPASCSSLRCSSCFLSLWFCSAHRSRVLLLHTWAPSPGNWTSPFPADIIYMIMNPKSITSVLTSNGCLTSIFTSFIDP